MAERSGFPYVEVQFTRDGHVHRAAELQDAVRVLAQAPDVTDLVVLAHGWNNDMREARQLYDALASGLRVEVDRRSDEPDRRLALLGVLWPSKRFAERDLIPSGAASASGVGVDSADLAERLRELQQALDAAPEGESAEEAEARRAAPLDPDLERSAGTTTATAAAATSPLAELLPRLEDDPQARAEFADRVRDLLPRDGADAEDASDAFFELDPGDLVERLGGPLALDRPMPAPGWGGAAGGAASLGASAGGVPTGDVSGEALGVGSWLSDARAGAARLLNFATYYVMKDRAGRVGSTGVAEVLQSIRAERPDLALHLVGHSFGARVVTAAAASTPLDPPAASLSLLQAAFSHNGFARRWDGRTDGRFRSVLVDRKVTGPIVVTCTANDRAVGVAYPLASRMAQQANSGLGDRDDPYGGLGRNGAQSTPEAVDGHLLATTSPYSFQAGAVHNLLADDFIADHSAVTGPEVIHAVAAAVLFRREG